MLDRIRAAIPALPPAEQRVAKVLLADARGFASTPASEIAERAHVSKPTAERFCRSVGYDGLADFKLKLAGSVNEGVPFVHRAVDEDDKVGDLVVKVVDNAVAALLRYRNAAAHQSMERAIEALAEAGRRADLGQRIELFGVGNSGIVARDAQHKFFRLGVRATAVSDGHVQVMSATMLRVGDCAVIISNSGRSHILLAADHPEDADRYSPMVSRLLHLLIIDILTTSVALRLGSAKLKPMLAEIKRNLRLRRYAALEPAAGASLEGAESPSSSDTP